MLIKAILTGGLFFGGLFFFTVGTVGILRFPDMYTRAHSAAKCDTLGAVLILLGLVVYKGASYASMKLILMIVFLWVTNPTATHLIAKAYEHRKEKEGLR